uniref:MPN domain-containing protein n=1 Tax=Spongospora subterranea TaxID=70186 RepID=A0A0H5R6M5_9EUKA|eukprot:CRZ09432.1 hypothetical protein [Spongospora subterranea]
MSALESVQLDGLAVIKIMKHAHEALPDPVSGQLLGLDVAGRLEVTGSFPMPSANVVAAATARQQPWQRNGPAEVPDDDEAARDDMQYQLDMMKLLREVNVDSNSVGWYQSISNADLLQDQGGSNTWSSIVATQFDYQTNIPGSVVIIYDPLRTCYGTLSIRAYRLTDAFMRFYKAGDQSREGFNRFQVDSRSIFEELPVKVHNSNLVHAFLYELRENGAVACEFDRLDMHQHRSVADSLRALGESIHEYSQEQGKYQFYQRSAARQKLQADKGYGSLTPPSRLDIFLITHSMRELCNEINNQSSSAYTRIFASEGLMQANME